MPFVVLLCLYELTQCERYGQCLHMSTFCMLYFAVRSVFVVYN